MVGFRNPQIKTGRRLRTVRGGIFLLAFLLPFLLTACQQPPSLPAPPTLAKEIVLYDWEGDIPQSVLDDFSAEFGVRVGYLVYENQEEAIQEIIAGQQVDVFVVDNRLIPSMRDQQLLKKLNHHTLSNFRYISPNFRGLSYDPENTYSIPYSWGATGLVIRTDLVGETSLRWSDMWNPPYRNRAGIWISEKREVLSLALKALGYSANSENPTEVRAAGEYLITLKPFLKELEVFDPISSAAALASGEVILAMGYAGDVLQGQEMSPFIQFVYPQDGALLWGDNYVVPVTTHSQYTAEVFINYLMRPEVAATITNGSYYASVNELALPLIAAEIRENLAIFPPLESLENAEILLPLSPEGQLLFDAAWDQFLQAEPVTRP